MVELNSADDDHNGNQNNVDMAMVHGSQYDAGNAVEKPQDVAFCPI